MAQNSLNEANSVVTPERIAAGRDYVAALDTMGVRIDAAMWGIDQLSRPQLLLITSLFDRVGPRTMYDALFKAYDIARTPRSIDPWEVSIHSPDTQFGHAVHTGSMIAPTPTVLNFSDGSSREAGFAWMQFSEFLVRADWVIRDLVKARSDAEAALRRWRHFEESLQAA